VADRAEVLASGTVVTLGELAALPAAVGRHVHAVGGIGSGPAGGAAAGAAPPAGDVGATGHHTATTLASGAATGGGSAAGPLSPLLRAARHHQTAFADARGAGAAAGMADAVLGLEEELWAWRADPTQSDEPDRVRAVLRAMVAELAEVAEVGTRDPATAVAPFVGLALDLRAAARADQRFADADGVRDRLLALGVEVRDTPDGTDWSYGTPRPAAS
jgi:hypothetical protein